MPQSLVLPDPSLETHGARRHERDHPGDSRPGEPRRRRLSLPDRGRAARPDFELLVNESQVSVPRGGTAAVGRDGQAQGLQRPDHRHRGRPARGADRAARARSPPARRPACSRSRRPPTPRSPPPRSSSSAAARERAARSNELAFKPVVFAQQTNLPTCSITEYGLVAAPALATPVTLDAPPSPIEVAHGFSATIPVKVVRTKGADGALAISALPLPAGRDRRRRQRSPTRRARARSRSRPHSRRPWGR